MSTRNLELPWKVLSVIVQAYLICWMLTDVKAQFDYENDGSLESSVSGHGSRGQAPIQMAQERTPWDHTNQVILEKCMQLQRMAVKKRNFGLEIPELIMTKVHGGTEGSSDLKDLRRRMVAHGKRK